MDPSDHDRNDHHNGAPGGGHEPTHANGPESDRWLRSVVDNSSEIVKIVDTDGTLRYASPAFGRILGYDIGGVVGRMNVFDHVHPEDLPHVLEETEKALSGGDAGTNVVEYRFRRKDGSWRWMESVYTYLPDDPEVRGLVVNARDVTERKEAREKLGFQSQLLGAVGEAVIALDMDGRVSFWNGTAEDLYGWSAQEASGRRLREMVVPEDLRGRAEEIMAEVKEGRTWTGEFVVRRRDGTLFPVEATNTPVFSEDGGFVGVISVLKNVTERKEVEEKLREAEERYRTLVEQIPAVTYIDHADGSDTPLYTSPQIEEMLGYTPEEWRVGRLWPKRLHPEDRDRVLAADEHFEKEGKERYGEEYRLIAKDGSVVWVREEAVLVEDGEDRPLFWQGIFYDLTERKVAEEALKESEERFRSTFEDAPIGVALVGLPSSSSDSNRRYLRVNRALCEMLGYSEQELLSKTSSDVTHPEDLEKSTARVERLLEEGGSKYTMEKRYVRSDGRTVWAMLNVSLVRDSEGRPSHFVAQFQDVTERKETEEALRRNEASLAESQRIAHLGTWEWDVATGEMWWSDETYRIYGFEARALVPTLQRLMEIVHPDDRGLLRTAIDDALGGNRPYDLEHRVVRPDGETRVVHRRAELVRDEGGGPLRIIGTVHDVTERKVLEDRLRHQAFHDPLTDLPNRQLFVDRLGHALTRTERRRGRRVAVLFMDLDGFKVVNDSLGHEEGDKLLVAVSKRLRGCLRPEDTLARFGGDEFIVLLEEVEGPDDALRVTQRITEEFRGAFGLDGREMFVRLSIGVALGDANTESSGELLRDADAAMYRAKDEVADYRVFDPVMYGRALSCLDLENDLRRALEKEEFTVYYQPKFRPGKTDRIEGIEALVRWEHPQRGFMLPGDFIPIAEETGLIIPIGEWVMREACRQAKEWQQRYPSEPPLTVCVNLSAAQVRHPGLLSEVRSALRGSGLDPGSLILEITEGTLLKDTQVIGTVFKELKALGVGLAIDDFGKEYSSLSYLNRLPVDGLKIDRLFLESFGDSPSNTIIVEAVISLAHSLGLEVTGEGVESAEQLELLRSMGCDFVQGYHLARPLPSEDVPEFLTK